MAPQAFHDQFPDFAGLALAFCRVDHERLRFIHNLLQLADWYRTLLTSAQQTVEHLLAVKLLPPAILLHDHVRDFVDALVGGKSFAALQTLAPAADGLRLFAFARVDHLIIRKSAKRTFHGADGSKFNSSYPLALRNLASGNLVIPAPERMRGKGGVWFLCSKLKL